MPGFNPFGTRRPRKSPDRWVWAFNRSCVIGFVFISICLPAGAAVVLPQADGSTLSLPRPAGTIITLAPHLTELAFAAGAGDQLAATVEYSEYPPEAASVPRIGDAFRLDLERILSINPDLVIAWHSGNPKQAVARLASLGMTIWSVEIRRPEEIAATLEQMGRATGNVDEALRAAGRIRRELSLLSQQYAGMEPVRYFYQVASDPLYTINGEHLIARSLALCGGVNVFRNESSLAPQISHEAVIAADPSALLAPAEPAQEDPLAKWREWPRMQAVRNGAMILLPADEISRATPRMLDAVATGCRQLDQIRKQKKGE